MLVIMLPVLIVNNGYFIYSGDYNYQHITFTAHAYNMIHSGMVKSDLYTALGTEFISSLSHIIVTPFFLVTLIMPDVKTAILTIPLVMALKTAVASFTSYLYIRRYVKDNTSAFIGALLYAFSGFQSFSFIFGSFHDITAWFPLMLLFLDQYFEDGKTGRFAVIVSVMAAMNAFFFYGQVIFLIIYFIVKIISKSYIVSVKKFVGIAIEAVSGVLMSAIFLYPGVRTLSSNSRVSEFINGIDCLSYSDSSIVWRVIQSIFMMPDRAGMTSLFQGQNTWTSISLYLPCMGAVFVLSYIKNKRRTWESKLLIVCSVMMMIPVLNSIFFMFNSAYYARWFYMPVLIMSLVTAKEIESGSQGNWKFGIKFSAVIMIIMGGISFLPGEVEKCKDSKVIKSVSFMGFSQDAVFFWRNLGIAALFVLLIYLLIDKYKEKDILIKKFFTLTVSGIILLNIIYIYDVNDIDKDYSDDYYGLSITEPDFKDTGYYRINGQQSNANLIWNIPGLDNFITTASPSLNDFYDEFDIKRMQTALIDKRYYPLNSLLSCKYYLSMATGDELNVERIPLEIEGFEKKDVQPYYHIFENLAYIPVGFSYDYYVTESMLTDFTEKYELEHPSEKNDEQTEETDDAMEKFLSALGQSSKYEFEEKYLQKMLVMLRAIVISDEDEDRYSSIIAKLPEEKLDSLGTDTYYADCQDRKDQSCSDFEVTKDGFSARINSDKENLVFFSVPYMEGWRAKVNGKDAEVVKVNYGFMAVKVDEGDNDIVFSYENPDYRTGGIISCVGLGLFALYMVACRLSERKTRK